MAYDLDLTINVLILSKILFLLKKEEYEDKEILYGENVRIIINIPEEDEKIFLEKLIEITEAKVNFIEP